MKRYFLFSLVAAVAGLTLFASCKKDDDKETNNQTATESRIVKVETLYGIEDYPYDKETTYEYDAQGRVTKRTITSGKGTVDEYSYSFNYSYGENQIICTSTRYATTTTLNLEGGLVRSEVLSYGSESSQINYEYDAENHMVREIYSEGDTVFHVWQNGNLMHTYTHKHSSIEVGAYDITTDYTFTDYSYSLFPFSDCGTGENALALKGIYGAQPKNLPATDQYVINDETVITGNNNYTYTLDEKGRVKSISVTCESLPYTIRVTWSN